MLNIISIFILVYFLLPLSGLWFRKFKVSLISFSQDFPSGLRHWKGWHHESLQVFPGNSLANIHT